MAKNIEPKLKKIGDYLKLEEDTVFTIPEYQRAYSWGIDNCDKLWQDINDFVESESKDRYFFGTIIINCQDNDTKYGLIDGQQRTTTFLLLLKALLVRINVAINRTASDEDSASLCRGLQERRRRIMGILYKAETEDISDKPEAAKDAEICRRDIILENYSINEQYKTELATILQATDFDSAEARVIKIKYKQKDNRYTNFFRNFKFFYEKISETVFCNCDDPFESNFFKYFVLNFNRLGLRKLIATCYVSSPIANTQLSLFDVIGTEENKQNKPYKAVVTKVYDKTGDGGIDMFDVAELFKSGENQLCELDGDGDFRSSECLALLDESDIVVTNPPFSLFREYIAILQEHRKNFIVIGNQNAITYKEIFPLLRDNEIWLGDKSGDMAFMVPEYYEARETRYWEDENGQKWRSLGNICWFTNLDIKKRHEELILVKRYDPDVYLHYVNYDAINVDKVADIKQNRHER